MILGSSLSRAARASRALTTEPLQALGLDRGEDLLLAELWREDGLTQAELARRLVLRPPTVSSVLRTMERRGLVERLRDADDGRAVRVYVTDRALELRLAVERIWREAEARLLRNLNRADRATLSSLLQAIE